MHALKALENMGFSACVHRKPRKTWDFQHVCTERPGKPGIFSMHALKALEDVKIFSMSALKALENMFFLSETGLYLIGTV